MLQSFRAYMLRFLSAAVMLTAASAVADDSKPVPAAPSDVVRDSEFFLVSHVPGGTLHDHADPRPPQPLMSRDAVIINGGLPYYSLQPTPRAGFELPVTPLPKGTVGQTYVRKSHPVPDDEHPRTAMLAIRDNNTVKSMKVQTMGGIRMKSGIWLFESIRPLDPGACQIVRVEARNNPAEVEPYDTRFVRLIPGRIVYLDF